MSTMPTAGALARGELVTWATFVGLAAAAFTLAGWLADGLLTLFAVAFGACFWLGFLGFPASLALYRALAQAGRRAQALAILVLGLALGTITGIATITVPMPDIVGHATPLVRFGLVALLAALMGAAQLFGWWLGIGRQTVAGQE